MIPKSEEEEDEKRAKTRTQAQGKKGSKGEPKTPSEDHSMETLRVIYCVLHVINIVCNKLCNNM